MFALCFPVRTEWEMVMGSNVFKKQWLMIGEGQLWKVLVIWPRRQGIIKVLALFEVQLGYVISVSGGLCAPFSYVSCKIWGQLSNITDVLERFRIEFSSESRVVVCDNGKRNKSMYFVNEQVVVKTWFGFKCEFFRCHVIAEILVVCDTFWENNFKLYFANALIYKFYWATLFFCTHKQVAPVVPHLFPTESAQQ